MNYTENYARLLVHYCLKLKEGERLFIQSTFLAEPLIRAIYKEALTVGAIVEIDLSFQEKYKSLINYSINNDQLTYVPANYKAAMETFEAYLYIRAPYNLKEDQNIDTDKASIRQKSFAAIRDIYFDRTGNGLMKRSLCQFPTQANAQEAGMSLSEYEDFIYGACMLKKDDPIQAWKDFGADQQKIADYLNNCTEVRYLGEGIDITFSCEGRNWINSDGQTNMPSGEVYTSPVENSVNGVIRFTMPAIYMGNEVEDVTLWVENGYIQKWEAKRGQSFLDYIFQLDGTRYFGEAAIGNNYNIDRFTKNILFDEKIGGTIHMAIGQSYKQAGGKNKSDVHWDMIADMRKSGEIYADGEKIYEYGNFLIN